MNTKSTLQRRGIGFAAAAAVVALGLAACAPAEPAEPKESAAAGVSIEEIGLIEVDESAAALLPERYQGGLQIASTIPHPPFIDFIEPGVTDKFVGVDYDLLSAIGARMGTMTTYNAMPFDGLIPGLQAGNFDVITGLADLKSRQETVTFVDYSKTGAAIMVRAGETSIKLLDDLCGKNVAAVKGTTRQQFLVGCRATSCGSGPRNIIEYPDEAASLQSLISGASDALLTAKVNALMLAKELSDKRAAVEDPNARNGYKANPNGIGVLNENADLAEAIRAAMQTLIDDGTYMKIYEKWGLGSIGVESAVINGAIN